MAAAMPISEFVARIQVMPTDELRRLRRALGRHMLTGRNTIAGQVAAVYVERELDSRTLTTAGLA